MTTRITHCVFVGTRLAFEGELTSTALFVQALDPSAQQSTIIFEVEGGRELDLDLRGSPEEVAERYPSPTVLTGEPDSPTASTPRKRGRPKLGVVGREITLLPRHWQWLDGQRGGASAALRRLIDEARKARSGEDAVRRAQLRTQQLLTALTGNEPGFEEALRALYSRDKAGFDSHIKGFPADVLATAQRWAEDVFMV